MKSSAAASMKLAAMSERTMTAAPRMAVKARPMRSPSRGTNKAETNQV